MLYHLGLNSGNTRGESDTDLVLGDPAQDQCGKAGMRGDRKWQNSFLLAGAFKDESMAMFKTRRGHMGHRGKLPREYRRLLLRFLGERGVEPQLGVQWLRILVLWWLAAGCLLVTGVPGQLLFSESLKECREGQGRNTTLTAIITPADVWVRRRICLRVCTFWPDLVPENQLR